jgi:hypothetical protein
MWCICRKESTLALELLERFPQARYWDDRAYLFVAEPENYNHTVLASDWLDENEEPLKELALFQKIETEIQADNELVVLISKGAAGQLYRWMVSAELIEVIEV